ncbi:MAG: transcriptional repressor [Gammaproteobacteria bacterium]|nr:transcriptional repressor [Gammaproteobacteria bacterium]
MTKLPHRSSEFQDIKHNHKICVAKALSRAKEVCHKNSVRFTDQRRRVLEIIWHSHKPILAYDILRKLRQEKDNAEPPTVYRALDFLLNNHLIHRIESLNAYIGCDYSGEQHISQFLICVACKQITEMEDEEVALLITQKALDNGLQAKHQTVEVMGLCPNCR